MDLIVELSGKTIVFINSLYSSGTRFAKEWLNFLVEGDSRL